MNLLTATCSRNGGKNSKTAQLTTTFAHRIENWMINNVRRSDSKWKLELPSDVAISSPLRALVQAKIAKVMPDGEEPKQGHSGRSIVGRGRATMTRSASPVPMPAARAVTERGAIDDTDHETDTDRHEGGSQSELAHPEQQDAPAIRRQLAMDAATLLDKLNAARADDGGGVDLLFGKTASVPPPAASSAEGANQQKDTRSSEKRKQQQKERKKDEINNKKSGEDSSDEEGAHLGTPKERRKESEVEPRRQASQHPLMLPPSQPLFTPAPHI